QTTDRTARQGLGPPPFAGMTADHVAEHQIEIRRPVTAGLEEVAHLLPVAATPERLGVEEPTPRVLGMRLPPRARDAQFPVPIAYLDGHRLLRLEAHPA